MTLEESRKLLRSLDNFAGRIQTSPRSGQGISYDLMFNINLLTTANSITILDQDWRTGDSGEIISSADITRCMRLQRDDQMDWCSSS